MAEAVKGLFDPRLYVHIDMVGFNQQGEAVLEQQIATLKEKIAQDPWRAPMVAYHIHAQRKAANADPALNERFNQLQQTIDEINAGFGYEMIQLEDIANDRVDDIHMDDATGALIVCSKTFRKNAPAEQHGVDAIVIAPEDRADPLLRAMQDNGLLVADNDAGDFRPADKCHNRVGIAGPSSTRILFKEVAEPVLEGAISATCRRQQSLGWYNPACEPAAA